MRRAVSLGLTVAVALSAPTRPAHAAEGPRDVSSDHLDGFDDGGPRRVGILVNPAGALFGVFGVEADLTLGEATAVSAEAAWTSLGGMTAAGLTVGLPVFPQRIAMHGFYVHPRVSIARAAIGGQLVDLAGAGATLGWEWTLRCGLTFRLGAGVSVQKTIAGDPGPGPSLDGLTPAADGDVGWLF